MVSEWRELAPLGGVRRLVGPGGAVQYEALPGETGRDARHRGTIAALVALCEEVLDDPDLYKNRDDYRQRLAKLQGDE